MTKLIEVGKSVYQAKDQAKSEELARELENGNILYFDQVPFDFPKEDIEFLLKQRQTGNKSRKNIAYKPHIDKITNLVSTSTTKEEQDRLLSIMRNYSYSVKSFLSDLLIPYASSWRLDYASFRPIEEKGRNLRVSARNDLLHTDAFPSRPTHGTRILRFFTNINPTDSRKWITSESFEALAIRFAGKEVPFPKRPKSSLSANLSRSVKRCSKFLGLPVVLRSPYDEFMLKFHHYLKSNKAFQEGKERQNWEFKPGSCWAVFTDSVTHAALAGQYALEQTLLVPRWSLLNPEKSPISVLERLTGESMVDSKFAPPKSAL